MHETQTGVRVELAREGSANVGTGLPVLDHLIGELATAARFKLSLEVAPESADEAVAAAGRALGEALGDRIGANAGGGWALVPAAEALASAALERDEEPRLVTNVDFSGQRVGGLATDVAARFLEALALAAGLNLHVRLVEGTDPQHVLSLQISLIGPAYAKNETVIATTEAIVARLRALPGVEHAAAAGQIPLGGNGDTWGFHIEGRLIAPDDPSVERYAVTPDYFAVMRIPLRRGRLFTEGDRAGTEDVMVIGDQTARAFADRTDEIEHARRKLFSAGFEDEPLVREQRRQVVKVRFLLRLVRVSAIDRFE